MSDRPDSSLSVLLVEDSAPDARLVRVALASRRGAAFRIRHVTRLAEGLAAATAQSFDVALLDLGLPDSQGLRTFVLLHARHRALPVVILSGLDDEVVAVDAVRLGAQDYLVKGKYDDGRLERAIRHAVERQRLLDQLVRALAFARERRAPARSDGDAAEDWLALCAWCKRVRDDEGQWQTIEEFLAESTQAQLTHGVCPTCAAALPGEQAGRRGK